jgi:3-isopropylmalate dehydrogenase
MSSWHPFVPLKKHFDFDIRFLRENTEDFYMGAGGRLGPGKKDAHLKIERKLYRMELDFSAGVAKQEMAFEIGFLSRAGVERFADYSFRYAAERGDDKITLVDKANVCTEIYGLQREIFEEKSKEHGIGLEYMLVDAMAMAMIVRPDTFGTVAVPNLFGDILTDLGAQLQGGLGLGASGNINPEGLSMFEPIHGSAPDIAGKDKANPIAAVLAAKMMLENSGYAAEGEMIRSAVRRSLDEGKMTGDLGGKMGTKAVGKEICRLIRGGK